VYRALLRAVPGLEDRLMACDSEDELSSLVNMVCSRNILDEFQFKYPPVAKGRVQCQI
jgi:hypothetical protein